MLARMQYKKVRIRPIARRIEPNGQELSAIDDWWQIESSSKEKLRLVNTLNRAITPLESGGFRNTGARLSLEMPVSPLQKAEVLEAR
jgi:hypothetical protein